MSRLMPTDQYIQVGDVRTRYWEAGEGGSPIVLVHGLGGYVERWENNIEALAQHHHVLALDLVGFGFTDKPAAPYSLPYLASFVRDFMRVKNIENATVIGSSLGAVVALELFLLDPEVVSNLVLVDGGILAKRKIALALRMIATPIIGELMMLPIRKIAEIHAGFMVHDRSLVTDEVVDLTVKWVSQPGSAKAYLTTVRSFADTAGVKPEVLRRYQEMAEEVTVPVLALWGREDRIVPVEEAYTTVGLLPNASLHIFEDCGHWSQVECADVFNEIVLAFLGHQKQRT